MTISWFRKSRKIVRPANQLSEKKLGLLYFKIFFVLNIHLIYFDLIKTEQPILRLPAKKTKKVDLNTKFNEIVKNITN